MLHKKGNMADLSNHRAISHLQYRLQSYNKEDHINIEYKSTKEANWF